MTSIRYNCEFGFDIPHRTILVDDIRVRAIGSLPKVSNLSYSTSNTSVDKPKSISVINAFLVYLFHLDSHLQVTDCYFEGGRKRTPVYMLEDLVPDHEISGPAIILNNNSTILIEPDCLARITDAGLLLMNYF